MEIGDLSILTGPRAHRVSEDAAALRDRGPLVITVDVEPDPSIVDEVATTMRRAAVVVVLRGNPAVVPAPIVAAADVCTTEERCPPAPWVHAPADSCIRAVESRPLVSLAQVALLRSTEQLPVAEGLAAEASTYAMLLESGPYREWLADRGPRTPATQSEPPVLVDRVDDTLHITLNRVGSRNAIDRATRDRFIEALELARDDPTIERVVLRGNGASFSAGGDLREFGTVSDGLTAFAVRLTAHPGGAVHEVADRVTAIMHGRCVGAGVEIPAFAGRVLAEPGTTFRLPELAMGLIPGAGGTVSITRRIGRHRTNWLVLTGTEIAADVAETWGLVDAVVVDQAPT